MITQGFSIWILAKFEGEDISIPTDWYCSVISMLVFKQEYVSSTNYLIWNRETMRNMTAYHFTPLYSISLVWSTQSREKWVFFLIMRLTTKKRDNFFYNLLQMNVSLTHSSVPSFKLSLIYLFFFFWWEDLAAVKRIYFMMCGEFQLTSTVPHSFMCSIPQTHITETRCFLLHLDYPILLDDHE